MFFASSTVRKTCTFLGGFLLAASLYTAVLYYPLYRMCTFCVTRAH